MIFKIKTEDVTTFFVIKVTEVNKNNLHHSKIVIIIINIIIL